MMECRYITYIITGLFFFQVEMFGITQREVVNQTNREGSTMLHSAVSGGCEKSVKVCLEFGASINIPQVNAIMSPSFGNNIPLLCPIFYLLAEKCGYERWQLLSMKDKERNSALHSAVNGGCETAVQVCLEFGAKLDVQQVFWSPVGLWLFVWNAPWILSLQSILSDIRLCLPSPCPSDTTFSVSLMSSCTTFK